MFSPPHLDIGARGKHRWLVPPSRSGGDLIFPNKCMFRNRWVTVDSGMPSSRRSTVPCPVIIGMIKRIARFSPFYRPRPRPLPRPRPRPRPGPPRPPPPPPRSAASFRALFLGLTESSMSRVSRGNESGRMIYRIVEPRMFIVSRVRGSWPRAVIFTVRSAVFICGETDVMVPCTIVPDTRVRECNVLASVCISYAEKGVGLRLRVEGWWFLVTIFQLNCHRFVGAFH